MAEPILAPGERWYSRAAGQHKDIDDAVCRQCERQFDAKTLQRVDEVKFLPGGLSLFGESRGRYRFHADGGEQWLGARDLTQRLTQTVAGPSELCSAQPPSGAGRSAGPARHRRPSADAASSGLGSNAQAASQTAMQHAGQHLAAAPVQTQGTKLRSRRRQQSAGAALLTAAPTAGAAAPDLVPAGRLHAAAPAGMPAAAVAAAASSDGEQALLPAEHVAAAATELAEQEAAAAAAAFKRRMLHIWHWAAQQRVARRLRKKMLELKFDVFTRLPWVFLRSVWDWRQRQQQMLWRYSRAHKAACRRERIAASREQQAACRWERVTAKLLLRDWQKPEQPGEPWLWPDVDSEGEEDGVGQGEEQQLQYAGPAGATGGSELQADGLLWGAAGGGSSSGAAGLQRLQQCGWQQSDRPLTAALDAAGERHNAATQRPASSAGEAAQADLGGFGAAGGLHAGVSPAAAGSIDWGAAAGGGSELLVPQPQQGMPGFAQHSSAASPELAAAAEGPMLCGLYQQQWEDRLKEQQEARAAKAAQKRADKAAAAAAAAAANAERLAADTAARTARLKEREAKKAQEAQLEEPQHTPRQHPSPQQQQQQQQWQQQALLRQQEQQPEGPQHTPQQHPSPQQQRPVSSSRRKGQGCRAPLG